MNVLNLDLPDAENEKKLILIAGATVSGVGALLVVMITACTVFCICCGHKRKMRKLESARRKSESRKLDKINDCTLSQLTHMKLGLSGMPHTLHGNF